MASMRVRRKMSHRLLVASLLWLIASFVYVASLASCFWINDAKTVGMIAVLLLAIAALVTRSQAYLRMYDNRSLHVPYLTEIILRTLHWTLLIFTCVILIMYSLMPESNLAKSNNALLSIFAFTIFFSGKSLFLRPFHKRKRNLR